MDNCEEVLKLLLEAVKGKELNNAVNRNSSEIPVGISNRHIHLSQKDLDSLFGENYGLTKIKDLSQPGQYACKEVVTICDQRVQLKKLESYIL